MTIWRLVAIPWALLAATWLAPLIFFAGTAILYQLTPQLDLIVECAHRAATPAFIAYLCWTKEPRTTTRASSRPMDGAR